MIRRLLPVVSFVAVVQACSPSGPSPHQTGLAISGAANVTLGLTGQLTAVAVFSDGTRRPDTDPVTWSVANSSIAWVLPTTGSTGLVRGLALGSTTILITSGAFSAQAQIQVGLAGGIQFDLTGTVVGEDGRPVSGATIPVNVGPGSVRTTTDASGHYEAIFTAVPGGWAEGATALVFSTGGGYENEFRFFRPVNADPHQTLDLHPRLITQITAGDSTQVTVVPSDTLCVNGLQDSPGLYGPDYVCRTVRILVPADGVLTVELDSASGTSDFILETEYLTTGAEIPVCASPAEDNPRTVGARAGTVFLAHVEMPASSTVSQTFTLKTSLNLSPQGCGSSLPNRRNR